MYTYSKVLTVFFTNLIYNCLGPPPPSNVNVINNQANDLTVIWNDDSLQAVQYKIYYDLGSSRKSIFTHRSNNPPKQFNLTNLLSNSKYQISVQTFTQSATRYSSDSSKTVGITGKKKLKITFSMRRVMSTKK